jgi:hypothetical protein
LAALSIEVVDQSGLMPPNQSLEGTPIAGQRLVHEPLVRFSRAADSIP